MDDVVSVYAPGFSGAINSYARILALFSDSSSLLQRSERSLATAGSHLASRKPALQAQWLRAATAAAAVSLLDAVAHAAGFEARVASALAQRRPGDAVTQLAEATAALGRGELAQVRGLDGARAAASRARETLFDVVAEQLLDAIYGPQLPRSGADAAAGGATHASRPALPPPYLPLPSFHHSASAPQLGGRLSSPQGVVEGLHAYRAAMAAAANAAAAAAVVAASASASAPDGGAAPTGPSARRRGGGGGGSSAATPPLSNNAPSRLSHPLPPPAPLDELVDALLRLGGGAARAREALAGAHGPRLRSLLVDTLRPFALPSPPPRPPGPPPPPLPPPPPPHDCGALDALEAVCEAVRRCLFALLSAQRRVATSPAAWAAVKGPLTGVPPSEAFATEAVRVWGATQNALEEMLADMLRPPPAPPPAPALRGAAALRAVRAEADEASRGAAAAARAAEGAARAAAAAAPPPPFSFGLAARLTAALAGDAGGGAGGGAGGAALSDASSPPQQPAPQPQPQPPQPRLRSEPLGSGASSLSPSPPFVDGVSSLVSRLPGVGPGLAPFASAPLAALHDAVQNAFPEVKKARGGGGELSFFFCFVPKLTKKHNSTQLPPAPSDNDAAPLSTGRPASRRHGRTRSVTAL